jgi:hypothetical protein
MTVRWTRAWMVLALIGGGCSRTPERGDVEGVVTLNGVPLPNVQVIFVPESVGDANASRSVGYADREGRYRLQGDRGETGAVIGRHVVAVTDPRSLPIPGKSAPQKGGRPVSRVPERYTVLSRTPLGTEVRAGAQTINLELVSAGK